MYFSTKFCSWTESRGNMRRDVASWRWYQIPIIKSGCGNLRAHFPSRMPTMVINLDAMTGGRNAKRRVSITSFTISFVINAGCHKEQDSKTKVKSLSSLDIRHNEVFSQDEKWHLRPSAQCLKIWETKMIMHKIFFGEIKTWYKCHIGFSHQWCINYFTNTFLYYQADQKQSNPCCGLGLIRPFFGHSLLSGRD